MRVISDSESENEMEVVDTCNLENLIERSADGTLCETLKEGGDRDRNVVCSRMYQDQQRTQKKKLCGMIEYIKICTETDARKILKKDDWSNTEVQLRTFISFTRHTFRRINCARPY